MNEPNPQSLNVPDLDEALRYFIDRLGFRLEMIVPADAPQTALLTGQGVSLRLESEARAAEQNNHSHPFLLNRYSEQAWHVGRANMQYRDLIPSRLGGRFIASHIRIPDGGAVADSVHYHKVGFQMIYCKTGWVRVVYEDQGEPFMLEAGDCVLQPPEIRHRVLEASAGLEVIEVGSPATHETWMDHELSLPTKQVLPERLFQGQRFVRHRASAARWQPGRCEGLMARDIGIADATNGLASVQVVKAEAKVLDGIIEHHDELMFWFVLQGELGLSNPYCGRHLLQAGDSCLFPAGERFALRGGAGFEVLEVTYQATGV
ncbi:MAG: cupin domain-containing protein [Acidobacteria bacterium]|nr:cupin domain-containing protein [Acidobacteriota bacterium]